MATKGQARAARLLGLFLVTFCAITVWLYWRNPHRSATESALELGYTAPSTAYKSGFDWQNSIPNLYRAAGLSSDKAVRLLMQTSIDLRTYVAIQLQSRCHQSDEAPQSEICTAKLGDLNLERSITARIDEILGKRTQTRNSLTSADCRLNEIPFPWTSITVMKSDSEPYTVLVLDSPRDIPYLESEVEIHYGSPDNRTTDQDGYAVMTYEKKTDEYDAKAEFHLDLSATSVRQLFITLRRRL
jgi:hypothetical protein